VTHTATSTALDPGTVGDAHHPGRLEGLVARVAPWQWLGLLWLVVTAYNLDKPFHIDDTAHLEIARWIRGHPLHPMSGMLNWGGDNQPISMTNQPHLYFYLLAGWSSVFGSSEIALHSMQALFALACVVLFHRQARRFCPGIAVWLTALLILGPAFVVEQNLMVDVPLLSLWLLFFELLLLHGTSPAQTRRYVLAGLVCGAAVLTKYSSLTLLPILAVSLLLERRARQAWTLLIPVLVLAAWSAFNWWDYGGIHVLTRGDSHASLLQPADFAVSWVVIIGAVVPLGLVAAVQSQTWLRRHERGSYLVVLAALVLAAVAVGTGLLPDRYADWVLAAAFAANGGVLLLVLVPALFRKVRGTWRDLEGLRRDSATVLLVLWLLGGTAFYLLFAPFIATRHVLLVLPPLLLLFGLCLGQRLTRWGKGFALVLTVLVAAGLCLGDWQFASFYRSSAAQVARSLPPTGTVWTSGHWGWQWYAEQNGMHQIDGEAIDLRPGDWVVIADDVEPLPDLVGPNLTLVREVTQPDRELSLFCTARPSRFYSSGVHGPWSLSRSCVGHLSIYKVTA
jgi:4-amino-4-deoxy-L-arabinose transferase-like glycosyltransferase